MIDTSSILIVKNAYPAVAARGSIMSTYYATQAAVRTTQAIMKAVKK